MDKDAFQEATFRVSTKTLQDYLYPQVIEFNKFADDKVKGVHSLRKAAKASKVEMGNEVVATKRELERRRPQRLPKRRRPNFTASV